MKEEILMFTYNYKEIGTIADEANFNRNMTEKVLRLCAILKHIDESEFSNDLVLKGGTAINLFVLDAPRLSVDIDLDFNLVTSREEMLLRRSQIDTFIRNYMEKEEYILGSESKFTHTLDSYYYSYNSTSSSNDALKIEINYSNRIHILNIVKTPSSRLLNEKMSINRLADSELIGSKMSALMSRTTPRDVWDVYNLFVEDKILNKDLIRKIAIFYICLGAELPIDFNEIMKQALQKINDLNFHSVKKTLLSLLHKGVKVNVEEIRNYVKLMIEEFFILDQYDIEFMDSINKNIFNPSILFHNLKVNDASMHPMGLWKISRNQQQ